MSDKNCYIIIKIEIFKKNKNKLKMTTQSECVKVVVRCRPVSD